MKLEGGQAKVGRDGILVEDSIHKIVGRSGSKAIDRASFEWYKWQSGMRKKNRARGLRLVFILLFIFALVYAQASDDPCPLHGRDHRHGLGASVAAHGLVCYCLLSFCCLVSFSFFSLTRFAASWINIQFSDRATILWVFEIFHPPRLFSS